MKIICLIDSLGSGGAQRQLVNLGIGLKSSGHEVIFAYYYKEDFYKPFLNSKGINTICIPSTSLLSRITNTRQFIRKGAFDVVIAFMGVPSAIGTFSGFPFKSWKLITSERSTNPLLLSSIKRRSITFSHLFSDVIISNSHANVALLKKANPLLKKRQVHVIYNSVNLNKFKPNQSFTFSHNDQISLFVAASYRRLKNLLGLVEAVNLLSTSEQAKLIVNWFGDKSFTTKDSSLYQAQELIKKYNLEKTFNLHSQIENIEKETKKADLVGLFSFHEGFPNAICEGMACGKPIITTSVSDLPRIIEDGVNGKLCNAHDPKSIASAIRFFLNSKTEVFQQMGKRNREKALELFDPERGLNDYLSLLQ